MLIVTLVMAGIGLVVSRSGAPGGQVSATATVDRYGCLTCHNNPDYQPKTSSRPWRELSVDEAILASSTHRTIECADCHTTCDTGQPIEGPAVQALCGACHGQEQALQEAGVHSDPEITTCLDCHSVGGSGHDVAAVLSPDSPVFRKNTGETCGGCHNDVEFMARYDVREPVYDTYIRSVHGKSMQLSQLTPGETGAATCPDCHAAHDVREVDDPASPVGNLSNLTELCASCHPGANEDFARSFPGHTRPSVRHFPIIYFGERFFFVLTSSAVGFGCLLVALDLFRHLAGPRHPRSGGRGDPSRDHAEGDEP